ncbi:MAG: chromosome segregation protein SMC [Acidobacteriota bacterium]
MRLHRLEITGFKSFCDRSELAFDKGVTAIVGPNGCGKSNVADAIVWVLGEQSARSLRGDRMEDVIFSGSDARKPNAAAEVRLMLSGVPIGPSTDAATAGSLVDDEGRPMVREVEVARRLYRSGESEYLINGELCRLKDVHELLMDTGLGAKAYAIIEQGKIGLILSSRPTDRRQLIEEAAGVTKYKARRRTAELKLEAAQQNLTRIDDIIFEVEKQRGTLKRQSAKARRYQRLRDELRRWEKVLFARRQRILAQAIAAAETRIERIRSDEALAAARVADLETVLEGLRLELASRESDARAKREAAHAHEVEIGRLEQRIQGDEDQLASLGRRSADVAVEIGTLLARRGPLGEEVKARQADRDGAIAEREVAATALAAASDDLSASEAQLAGLESDVEAVRNEQFAAANAATTLQHTIDGAAAARDRVARDLSRLSAESADLDVEVARVEQEHARAAADVERGRRSLETLVHDRIVRETELAAVRAEREGEAQSLRQAETQVATAQARLLSLERFESSRRAYGDGARLILAGSAGSIEHFGSVADHLEVTPGYERAVEACLGDALQYIVVPSHAVAAEGLRLLREHRAGHCGFVVAREPVVPHAEEAPPRPGLVPLSSVVRLNGPHKGALAPVALQGWIAPSFDAAVEAAQMTPTPVGTTDGAVCRTRHLVAGGTRGDDGRGILDTKREIRDLHDELTSGRSTLARLSERVETLDAHVIEVTTGLDAIAAGIHELEKAMVGYELRVAQAAEDERRLQQKRDLVARDTRGALEELAGLDSKQAEARASILRLGDQQRHVDERLGAAQRRLFAAREAARQYGERVKDAMTSHARLAERAAGLAVEAARLEESQRELESRLVTRRDDQTTMAADQDGLRLAIAEGRRALDAELQALDAARVHVQATDDHVNELRTRAAVHEGTIRDARHAHDEVRTQRADAEVQLAKAESDLAHLAETVVETLQTGLDEVIVEVEDMEQAGDLSPDWRTIYDDEPDEETVADTGGGEAPAAAGGEDVLAEPVPRPAEPPARPLTPEEAIAELKRKIDRLGPVNMMAIEQFEELEGRHGFLTSQRKDLVDSIASTGEAIRKIDLTTRQRFREAFDAINANFQEMFARLFGGGRAGLTLLDEHDLLESGIEVIAQPPGKRLQNVQLLSGGEKALTAISLMFAIFQYKPSPFCVLDEIDAPLDDANTGRFLDMLRTLQAQTQFILITHNRQTMEIADRLYGVTMEEAGVSKLISVRLN